MNGLTYVQLSLTLVRSITLGKTWSPGEPQHYDRGMWSGFIVVLVVNVLSTFCPST